MLTDQDKQQVEKMRTIGETWGWELVRQEVKEGEIHIEFTRESMELELELSAGAD